MNVPFAIGWAAIADFIDSGGWVVYWIVAVAAVLWTLILERYFWYFWVYPKAKAVARQRWLARSERHSWTARRIRAALISELTVAMTAPLPFLKCLIPIAPLLGLLGTVAGMLEVFDVMAIKGQSDPKAMSEGVSKAMIATLSGLAVSLSGMYFALHFQNRATRETERLNGVLPLEDHGK